MVKKMLLLMALLAGLANAEPAPRSPAWLDDLWLNHLMQRGRESQGQPVLEEAFYRDALAVNPRSVAAVEALAQRYRANEEAALTAAAVCYGRLVEPNRPAWSALWAWAWPRVEKGPAAASGKEDEARHAKGLETMLAAVKKNDLIQAEQAVRTLLRATPRDARLMENLATFARLTGQPAQGCMAFAFMLQLYPTNFPVANNLTATLEQAGLPGPAFDTLSRFVPLNPSDSYVLGNAARLADAAGRYEEEDKLAAQWRAAQPANAEAWLAATRAALRQGKATSAQQFWRETVVLATPEQLTEWRKLSPYSDHASLLQEAAP